MPPSPSSPPTALTAPASALSQPRPASPPDLVIHHFGSKEELRAACDKHVAGMIRDLKSEAMAAGAGFDPLAALRSTVRRPAGQQVPRPHACRWVAARRRASRRNGRRCRGIHRARRANGMMTPTQVPPRTSGDPDHLGAGRSRAARAPRPPDRCRHHPGLLDDPHAIGAYVAPAVEIAAGYITETTKELMMQAFVDAAPEEKKEECMTDQISHPAQTNSPSTTATSLLSSSWTSTSCPARSSVSSGQMALARPP